MILLISYDYPTQQPLPSPAPRSAVTSMQGQCLGRTASVWLLSHLKQLHSPYQSAPAPRRLNNMLPRGHPSAGLRITTSCCCTASRATTNPAAASSSMNLMADSSSSRHQDQCVVSVANRTLAMVGGLLLFSWWMHTSKTSTRGTPHLLQKCNRLLATHTARWNQKSIVRCNLS